MIKRRFYKLEHGDRDAPSQSSSSSSDFEFKAEATEESEEEFDDANDNQDNEAQVRENEAACCSSSSGYESEDSSANEVNLDSSGFPTSDDDGGSRNDRDNIIESHLSIKENVESISVQQNIQQNAVPENSDIPSDVADYVVKLKSVFKCRLCPRIVCLTGESLKAHLKSKRHARSEKLLKEGRLKLMLDDDGKVDGETYPESNSSLKISAKKPMRTKIRHMQNKKLKKKKGKDLIWGSARQSAKNPAKNRTLQSGGFPSSRIKSS